MTFISAFRCKDGIVLGADSQETCGDYKLTVDKLKPVKAGSYEIAVGGCGIGDLVDSLCDHIQEWVERWPAASEREIKNLLRQKMREFYSVEVSAYPAKKLEKRITALLCLKHDSSSDVLLFELRGSTVRRAPPFSLIGWELPITQQFVRRLYNPTMPISQGVLLTLYLFSLVGSTVTVVGGDTRIVIGRDNGLRVHDNLYVSKIEENISLFTKLIDKLVLSLPDTSLTSAEFEKAITEFVETAKHLRKEYLHSMGHLAMLNVLTNPSYQGDSYPIVPPGAVLTLTADGNTITREDPEHVKQMKERFEKAVESLKVSDAQK